MIAQYEEIIASYIERQVGICDQFLTRDLADSLFANLLDLNKNDKMNAAGTGNLATKNQSSIIRTDKVCWIDQSTSNSSERAFLTLIEQFIIYLNDSCYTGITDYEFHYAIYESGTCYHKHRDQFRDNQDRKFSLINYLNCDWKEEDAGELWIYHKDRIEKIKPDIQKAVFFKSDTSEHEVRMSTRQRMSITGWLKSS